MLLQVPECPVCKSDYAMVLHEDGNWYCHQTHLAPISGISAIEFPNGDTIYVPTQDLKGVLDIMGKLND